MPYKPIKGENMSFTTKMYTKPFLLKKVRSINVNNFSDVNSFAKALSPRSGRNSAQFAAFRTILNNAGYSQSTIFNDSANLKDAKKTILSLLK